MHVSTTYKICFNEGFPVSEEPEEQVTLEDLMEKAKSGDAKAQTKVSGMNILQIVSSLSAIW